MYLRFEVYLGFGFSPKPQTLEFRVLGLGLRVQGLAWRY